jgi:DNA-binding response OmpR family regulator
MRLLQQIREKHQIHQRHFALASLHGVFACWSKKFHLSVHHFFSSDFFSKPYIGYLRKKLGEDYIETVRGIGYRLHDPKLQSDIEPSSTTDIN